MVNDTLQNKADVKQQHTTTDIDGKPVTPDVCHTREPPPRSPKQQLRPAKSLPEGGRICGSDYPLLSQCQTCGAKNARAGNRQTEMTGHPISELLLCGVLL